MEKKTIVACAEVLAGEEKEFIIQAEKVIKATRKEEGNISYNLFQNPFKMTSFIFYEEYKDEAAIEYHASSDHFKKFAKAIEGILASELIIEKY